jgi:hypothetical protein
MGWKETNVNEQVGKDGGPIETKDVSAVDMRVRCLNKAASLSPLDCQADHGRVDERSNRGKRLRRGAFADCGAGSRSRAIAAKRL